MVRTIDNGSSLVVGQTSQGGRSLNDNRSVDAVNNSRSHEMQTRTITLHEEGSRDTDVNEENSFLTTYLTMGMPTESYSSTNATVDHGTLRSDPEVSIHLDEEETSDEEYHSFESDTDGDGDEHGTGSKSRSEEAKGKKRDYEAREMERQRVLEAAGLFVKASHANLRNHIVVTNGKSKEDATRSSGDTAGDFKDEDDEYLAEQPKARRRRRAAPAPPETPKRLSVASYLSEKELPQTPASIMTSLGHIDDAFERYEAYRQSRNYRLSMSSIETGPPSPGHPPPSISATPSRDANTSSSSINASGSHSHSLSSASNIFGFLTRSKTPTSDTDKPRLQISGPITSSSSSTIGTEGGVEGAAFGSSWASLIDKEVLEGIPALERKRQEAIFELITTEAAYVRDLQLIVEVFYSSTMALLTEEEVSIVFANIEDLLLVNTTFLSSLEERQKDCRLYIDSIGDLLETYMNSMAVYSDYCINQSNAINVLQSIRDKRPEVASHLQRLREDPSVRNLDLSSYLLAPMQRITRYPLLIRQILNYTEVESDRENISRGLKVVERVLKRINESIRDQEGRARLEAVSKTLYVGQGRLDLAKCTSYMGSRKLLKEGSLSKYKSGRKLRMLLCNDMIILTDASVSRLYKMPIQLNQVDVKELPNKDELGFQLVFAYPRGGEAMAFKAANPKECQIWMKAISSACRRARDVERRAIRVPTVSRR